jgi:hypothetical protein
MQKTYVLPALAMFCIIALLLHGPIPQNQDYHHFADQRNIFGIPNFFNVITNIPFAIVALFGLREITKADETKFKNIGFTLFVGFILVTLGSGYYHLWPDNETLVWDRIPITVILMSFFSFLIYDLIDRKTGYKAFIILNLLGIMSVLYWHLGERQGGGDLRWYAMVQFFPVIAIPLILILYKSSFNHYREVIPVFLFFGLAKLAESFDKEIYHLLNQVISGHSIKHLFMAGVEFYILRQIARRVKIGQ